MVEKYDRVSFSDFMAERKASPDGVQLMSPANWDFVGENFKKRSALDVPGQPAP